MKVVIGSELCSKCQQLKQELEDTKEEFIYKDVTELTESDIYNISKKHGVHLPIVYEE
jgi:Mg2+ and Co2+ transporter CorA